MRDKSNPHNMELENELRKKGYILIACVDECGRGSFAGPVIAGAVIMPANVRIDCLTDSKQIPKKEHIEFANKVKATALSFSIGEASVEEIDSLNIKQATRLAMERAVEGLHIKPDYLLIDGTETLQIWPPCSQQFVIKGDYVSHGISCAAILAKVYRDNLMTILDEESGKVYDWAKNAGYGTKVHLQACRIHGVTDHHRKSWKTHPMYEQK